MSGNTLRQGRGTVSVRNSDWAPAIDRVSLVLGAVLLLAAGFYFWTAGTSYPMELSGSLARIDPYNQLANAFLHFHLSVGRAPAGLVKLREPYNPALNTVYQRTGIHDFALYRGRLYLTWGPAPVIVLLVPLHLLGIEPTASITVPLFASVGLGFVLAALRVVLRQIGDVPLWMCLLAALALALCSAMPFTLRLPAVYEEAIAGGYCFAMAAIWLAISAVAEQRATPARLLLMSLCVGLAAGSRPTLALVAVVLIPVYLSLRATRSRRGLLAALLLPLGTCAVLLLLYNAIRFGNPLENGTSYQLADIDTNTAPWDRLSYVPPGLWFYLLSPPRSTVLFPFLALRPPPISYPGSLSALYRGQVEQTGGLLAMAPIVAFLAALPWIWRRRPTALGRLAMPLSLLAAAGVVCLLFLSYVFFATTERYEVDFTTLLLLGALATWLALARITRGWRRRAIRLGGALLLVWGCIAGTAISFTGYANLLSLSHPGIWKKLVDLGSPVSAAIARVGGSPVLAEVVKPGLLIAVGEKMELVIVSPGTRVVPLHITWGPAEQIRGTIERAPHALSVLVDGVGHTDSVYRAPVSGEVADISARLAPGVNRVTLAPRAAEASGSQHSATGPDEQLYVQSLRLG